MSIYSFSEEGSETNADEELLRDLDNLREVLEEDESAVAHEEEGDRLGSLAERPLEGLKLCLQKNHENQVLFKWLLKKIDKALETNRVKREDIAQPTALKRRQFTLWKFTRGSYFKDQRGRSAPCSQDVLSSPGGPRNFYLTDNLWQKTKEDAKLIEGVRMIAIEKRSYPLQEKLMDAKTNDERRALRKQINAFKDLKDDELFADLELTDSDWYNISYAQFNEQKTTSDCRLRWENCLNPGVYNGSWSKEEEKRLMKVANQHQCTDWKAIARDIGTNRTAFSCLKHYQELFNRSSLQKQQWTPEMDKRLREGVGHYGEKNWRSVAAYVGNGYSHSQCLHRWFNSTNPTIKKGRWSKEEDELLKVAVKTHNTKWSLVACMVPSRTPTQCRERWVNVLDSNLNRGKWDPEEDERLITICRKYEGGSIPWAKVAQELGRRTDAMCSFRWRSLSSTPEVVQQYARRVAEKALTKKSNLSASEIDQDMLPEACLQKVEEYKDRLINFKARRRKSSTCPSPEMVLRERGEHIFTEDPSSTNPPTTRSKASPLVTNSRSASTSRGSDNSGAGQTQASKKKGRKRKKKTADSAPSDQQPPPKKKRAPRKRARVQHADGEGEQDASIATGSGPSSQNDMMQLTERFMQQHYTNMLSQMMPTLPLLTRQQLSSYVPTSVSWMGIPIWMGRSDAAAITQAQRFQIPSLQIPPPPPLTRPSATRITSSSVSMTSQGQGTSTSATSRLSGLQVPPAVQLPPAPSLTRPFHGLPITPQSLHALQSSIAHGPAFPPSPAPALTRLSQSLTTSSHSPTLTSPPANATSAIQSTPTRSTVHSQIPLSPPNATRTSSLTPAILTSTPSPTTSATTATVIPSVHPAAQPQIPLSQSNTASSSTPVTIASSSSSSPMIRSSSAAQNNLTTTAPTIASRGHAHVTSPTTTQTTHPSPTQTSPSTPIVSSPTITPHSTEAPAPSQNSVSRQVSHGQTSSVSTRSQAPTSTEEVLFPKGPHFITVAQRPEPVAFLTRRLNTAPSSSSSSRRRPSTSTMPSFIQPHASLLAPEFRKSTCNFTSFGAMTASPMLTPSTSITFNYMSSPPRTLVSQGTCNSDQTHTRDSTQNSPVQSLTLGTGTRSASSPLNLEHPVGAAVSALLSLSDRTNSRSPTRYATASPLPRMSYSPLMSGSHQLATTPSEGTVHTTVASFPGPLRRGEREGLRDETTTISTSNNVSRPLATTTTVISTAGGVLYTSSSARSAYAPAITIASSGSQTASPGTATQGAVRSRPVVARSDTLQEAVAYMRVPDAVRFSEDLSEESETMKLSQEQTVALEKVDGPSLISTNVSNDDDLTCLDGFTREASIESDLCLDRSSVRPGSTHTPSPRDQRSISVHLPTEGTTAELANMGGAEGNGTVTVENNSSTARDSESQDKVDSRPPSKRPRKTATKPRRKTSTRQRTPNSKK